MQIVDNNDSDVSEDPDRLQNNLIDPKDSVQDVLFDLQKQMNMENNNNNNENNNNNNENNNNDKNNENINDTDYNEKEEAEWTERIVKMINMQS